MSLCDRLIDAGAKVFINRVYDRLDGPVVEVHLIVAIASLGYGDLNFAAVCGNNDADADAAFAEALLRAASDEVYICVKGGKELLILNDDLSIKRIPVSISASSTTRPH